MSTITQSFYAVRNADGLFFAGFDSSAGKATFTSNVIEAKLFSNKFEIPLRPTETLVELKVALTQDNVTLSEPFRPNRRKKATARPSAQ